MSTPTLGIAVGIADAVDAQLLRQGLQLAVAVRNADRADMIALDEQQLERDASVAPAASASSVVTDMPSCTGVVQAGSRRSTPDTSTMHSRQAPTAVRPSM